MATWAQDPVDFSVGIDPNTIVINLIHTLVGTSTAYDAGAGGWQAGYGGTIVPDGTGGYDVTISTHPFLQEGTWTVSVTAATFIGVTSIGYWTFSVSYSLAYFLQSSENTIDLIWDEEPLFFDPSNQDDSGYLGAYTLVCASLPARLLQAVSMLDDERTIRLWYDGPLIPDESYTFSIVGLKSKAGHPRYPYNASVVFTAFGADKELIPLRFESADKYDIANPQIDRDALGGSLGTFRIDETGDLDVETRRSYLRKRILRRCTTKSGGFIHLIDYGFNPDLKKLIRPNMLRKLQQDAESQIIKEPDVVSVRATVSQPYIGVVWLKLDVTDRFGSFNIETMIGDEDA
jgi:hypothetical protein